MRRRQFAMGAALCACPALRALAGADPAARELALQLSPMASTRPGETHAALAVSEREFGGARGAYAFCGRMRALRQLRQGSAPNPWESAWLFWNFQDNDRLSYFALKANGWEVGERDPTHRRAGVNDGQRIVATGSAARAAIGRWHGFELRVDGELAEIMVDGAMVHRFRDPRGRAGGRLGLYTEDALCQWSELSAPGGAGFEGEKARPLSEGERLANWRVAFLGYGSGTLVEVSASGEGGSARPVGRSEGQSEGQSEGVGER